MRFTKLVRAVTACTFAAPCLPAAQAHAEEPAACFAALAATRNATLGLPHDATLTPDGRAAFFLRSGPRDTQLRLMRYDIAAAQLSTVADESAGSETLSVEERARRERARLSLSGITAFRLARDGRDLLATNGGRLEMIDAATLAHRDVPGRWLAPVRSPDGDHLAAVKDDDLYVLDTAGHSAPRRVTNGGSGDLTHGLAEFAAAEELERPDGTWWSPDGSQLLYEEADSRGVEKHFIANPQEPQTPPLMFRYPRAGTANARLRLGLVSAKGGPTRWVAWDSQAFPYLGRVVWRRDGGLFLVVLNRAQTTEQLLSVDGTTGRTRTVLTDTDAAWLDLAPMERAHGLALPYALPDGRFLWAAQRSAHWQLELHRADGTLEHVLTSQSVPFLALLDVDPAHGSLVIASDTTRIDTQILRIGLKDGGVTPLIITPGHHLAHFTEGLHERFLDDASNADGTRSVTVRDHDGKVLATLPSAAAPLPFSIHPEFTRAGPLGLDAIVLRPHGFSAGQRYPVILSVYGGPGVKEVNDTPAAYASEQCLADQGYVVVALDGRGTPGRDHDFERATRNDLIDLPLQDQIDGLKDLAAHRPEMDLQHVGVYGWSFGGYFTAMATIRRPDVFASGVAGAPPVDFADYDTAYTERYLGTPQDDPEGYRKSNVLTYADGLARPLLILHGLTDDNVYFENTMKLTQALLRAGKPYDLMLLPGTHMLTDPALRTRVDEARAAWFAKTLKSAEPRLPQSTPPG